MLSATIVSHLTVLTGRLLQRVDYPDPGLGERRPGPVLEPFVTANDQIDGHSSFPTSESAETLGRKFTISDVD